MAVGERIDKASEWATRCVYESKQWKNNCFVTLTYNQHSLKSKSLIKKDIQDFMKRLRKQYKGIEPRIWKVKVPKTENIYHEIIEYPIRYFYSGEYGEQHLRPHFHIGFFNWIPDDLKLLKTDKNGNPEYTSAKLEKIWGNGFIMVKRMTYETATYIARYTMKKLFDKKLTYIKHNLTPEFIETSRRGGIGYQILENKEEFEKMKRNFGIYINTTNGTKLRKVPNFIRIKWRELNDEERFKYFEIADNNRIQAEESTMNALAQTSYTIKDYLQIQKRTLLEKLKNRQCLKRNRITTQQ